MKTLLENIETKMTTAINGHVVTRWSDKAFEVDTWGRNTVDINEALRLVRQ